MTGGGTATPEPLDLSEISRSGDLFDALATRRVTDLGHGSTISDDPAARLLAALVADVDVDAPPLPAPARISRAGAKTSGRPVVRAFVTFGAVTVMLTTAGAAVAGGGGDRAPKAHAHSARLEVSERSKPRLEAIVRAFPGGPRPQPAADRTPEANPSPRPSPTKTSEAPATPSSGPTKKGSGLGGPRGSRGPRAGHSADPSPTLSPTAPADLSPTPSTPSATSKPPDETFVTPSDRSRRRTSARKGRSRDAGS
ncbi:hypothetical protein NE236_06575 [Actinoallomurus purpureus]|uniref:hypothetical protein n=1 Tax=Actinoallomurus purpureus TaxID=478114 RepID=UPI002092EF1C|nr:hypothetical protein [Actinoallomurus purpureus]MCO6004640.1 hypothetical protein [Actinoallomurus purpureus]